MTEPAPNTLLTVTQASQLLNLSKDTLYHLADCRRIRHVRMGRTVRFRPQDVQAFIDENTVEPENGWKER